MRPQNSSVIAAPRNYAAPREKAAGKAVAADAENKANEGGLESTAEDGAVARRKKQKPAVAAIPRPKCTASPNTLHMHMHELDNPNGHNGFVFMCSDATYQECVGRCLFGLPGTRIPSLYMHFTLFWLVLIVAHQVAS